MKHSRIDRAFILFFAFLSVSTYCYSQILTESFEGSVPNTNWTNINNGTGNIWSKSMAGNGYTGSYSLRCGNSAGQDDTWLITSPQTLTAGVCYSLNFWYKISQYTAPQKLKITVGTSNTVAAQSTVLWDCNNGSEISDLRWEWANCTFIPTISGTYYFALNCYSSSNSGYLYLDDFKLETACTTSLSGSVNVGSGQTLTSLTCVNGLFQKINSCGLNGNLTVNITSNLAEDGTYCINDWKNTAYSVTIQPTSASVKTISGNITDGLIRINGADQFKIDGNYNGNGQYLCFQNTNISDSKSKVIGIKGIANNCTIKNARILHGYFVVHQSNQANTGNSIINCSIEDFGNIGIQLYGGIGTSLLLNSIFQTTTSPTNGSCFGILNENATATLIEKNRIFDLKPYYEIDADPDFSTFNDIIGINIKSLSGGIPIQTTVRNNMITLVESKVRLVKGIEYGSSVAGSSCDVCFNSIYLGGSSLNSTEYPVTNWGYLVPSSYCISNLSSLTFNCYNNLNYNNRSSSVLARKNYAIFVTDATNTTSDYNDLYAPGANAFVGKLGTTDHQTIAAWKAASGKDVNSFNQDPGFINTAASPFDLHIQADKGRIGITSCGISDDIDLTTRTNPNIGADEIVNNLPVELLFFTAECESNVILLDWASTSEINNDYFVIERSNDQEAWDMVATVQGAGNSNSIIRYHLTDTISDESSYYYRIKQVDYNGAMTIFSLIQIGCRMLDPWVSFFPNPFSSCVYISYKNIIPGLVMVKIHDVTGQVVYFSDIKIDESDSGIMSLDLGDIALKSGVYSIEFKSANYSISKKILKE